MVVSLCSKVANIVITPQPAGPRLINFFKPIQFMASDSSSGFRQGYHTFLYGQTNTTERMEEKEQTNKHGLGSALSAKKGKVYVTLFIFRAFVDYRGRVFFAKLLQKPLTMLTSFRVG